MSDCNIVCVCVCVYVYVDTDDWFEHRWGQTPEPIFRSTKQIKNAKDVYCKS